jgi:hypothetical protein
MHSIRPKEVEMVRSILISSGLAGALVLASAVGRADTPNGAMRVDGQFDKDAGQGCHYTASVHGTVVPSKSNDQNQNGSKGKTAKTVEPTLDVTAGVTCPNVQALDVTDSVNATGPLTEAQLSQAIDRRATITTIGSKGRCIFTPDFTLENGQLKLQNVRRDCK